MSKARLLAVTHAELILLSGRRKERTIRPELRLAMVAVNLSLIDKRKVVVPRLVEDVKEYVLSGGHRVVSSLVVDYPQLVLSRGLVRNLLEHKVQVIGEVV